MFRGLLILFLATCIHTHHTSLRLVHLVFRHGQRTPASTYPNDPHINETFAPYGWGQLTNEGKLQQFEQGEWLRNRYSHFLGDQYHPDLLTVTTTDVDRTKMSAQYMFLGLLPPSGPQIWNQNVLCQAIPMSSQKLEKDRLLLVRGCSRYSEAIKELMATNEMKDQLKSSQELYNYLSKHSGVEVKDPEGVEDIYSTLKAEEDFKLKLPDWTKPVYPEKMREETLKFYALNSHTTELKRIKGGPLLKKILDDSKMKAEGKLQGKKLFAYAGHDSTVVNLLTALGVWHNTFPVYSIMAIVEVHEQPEGYGIKVLLRNSTTSDPRELTIPDCESPCPIDKAYKLLANVLITDVDKACESKDENYKPPKDGGP